jgi:hypothetical protein
MIIRSSSLATNIELRMALIADQSSIHRDELSGVRVACNRALKIYDG